MILVSYELYVRFRGCVGSGRCMLSRAPCLCAWWVERELASWAIDSNSS